MTRRHLPVLLGLWALFAPANAASWTTTTPLPDAYNGHSMVYASGRLYLAGGISFNGGIVEGTKVYSAPVTPSGSVGGWAPTTPLPEAVFYHASAAANGYVYVLGGYHYTDAGGITVSDAVSYAKINADGSLGAWQSSGRLPQPVFFLSAAVSNGRLYVTGGWNGSSLTSAVYSAVINPDGSLGAWATQKPLPEAVYTHAEVANGTLYVLGGTVHGGADIFNTVYFAKINADGTLADWATTSPLPQPVANHTAVMANGRLFVMGGWTGSAPTDAVNSAAVAADGTLGSWSTAAALPRPLYLHASTVDSSHIFVSGGNDPADMRAEVYSMPLPPPADALPPRTSLAFSGPLFGGTPFISPTTLAGLSAVDDANVVGDGAGVGVASTQWALDGGAFGNYTAPFTVSNDGAHWIRFFSVDRAGNAEAVRASSAAVDGSAPVSSLSIGSPRATLASGETIVGPATPLAVSAVDPVVNGAASGVGRVSAGVDGAPLAAVSGSFLLPAADGAHSVAMQAADNVGNAEAVHSAAVYRDGTTPRSTLEFSAPPFAAADGGAPIVSAATRLSFTASDPTSGGAAAGVHHTEYALDGGAATVYTGGFGLAEGPHAVTYLSVDNVGNAEAGRSVSLRSDATLPQSSLSWDGAPASPTPETAFTLSAQDPVSNGVASGVREIVYSLDGGAEQAYVQPFRLAQGRHTIAYAATDNVGNAEDRNSEVVTVGAADDLPPRTTLAFGSPLHGSVPFISPATPATLTAVDDARVVGDGTGVGVAQTQWSLDSSPFAPYTASFRVAGDGAHWIRFFSVDAAGHAEAVRASSAAVDGTPPLSELSVGSPQAILASGEVIVGPATPLSVSAEDPVVGGVASGVSRVFAGLDGAAPVETSGDFILPAVDGAHTVLFSADDHVGNSERVHSATIHRDGVPPVTALAFSAAPYAGPDGPIYGVSTEMSFTAADPVSGGTAAGVHRTEYAFDGGSAAVYAGPFGAAEGPHSLAYRSFDNVGNAEASRAVSFSVDATPPQTALAVEGGTALLGADILTTASLVSLSATDPVSNGTTSGVRRVVYSVDGGPDQAYAGPFSLAAGGHTVSYGAVDNAGNDETRHSASLSVGTFLADALAALDSVALSGGAGVTGSVRTNGDFTANGKAVVDGDVTAMTVSLKGQSKVLGTVTQGRATLSASYYDLAAASAWVQTHNDNAALPAGLLSGGALTLTSRQDYALPAGDYYLTGLTLAGQSRLSVSGRVHIFLHGPLSVSGGGELNAAGEANDLWIIADAGGVSLSGDARSAFNLYAPSSDVVVAGNGQFAGRVFAKTASLSGKALQPSTSVLPPSRHGHGREQRSPHEPRGGSGTAGSGHASDRDSAVASRRLDWASPRVAPRRSDAPAAGSPSGPAPTAVPSGPAHRETKHLPAAARQDGKGTTGPGRSDGREAEVSECLLALQEPEAARSAAALPATPGRPDTTAQLRAQSSRVAASRMPAFKLAARAAFSPVASAGGAVRAKDGSAVVIPEGATADGLGVTVSPPKTNDIIENARQAEVESSKGLIAAAAGVQYGPEGARFVKPVTLELPYDRAHLPAGLAENDLRVHYWNPAKGDWERLDSSVDTQNQIVRAQTTHFSLYKIFGGGSAASAPAPNDPTFAIHAAYAFPNPSRGGAPAVIRVQPGLADSVSVRVYDVSGRLVHESSDFRGLGLYDDQNGFGPQYTFDHAWDVSGVGSGVYRFIVTARKAGAADIRRSGKIGVIK